MAQDEQHQREDDNLKFEYDRAYYRTLFCPESELKAANEMLQIWRHKYFSH